MRRGPRAVLAVLAPALLAAPPVPALAAPAPAPARQAAGPVCTPADPDLAELSGLAGDGRRWFALSDGGSRLEVSVLDPRDCSLADRITADVNPYDVEDLALAADRTLWLADTGDNDRRRDTVALHRLTQDGTATLYRLSYPDGPHDAEALLLDRAGVPYLVTKQFGAAGVYRPAGPLAEPGPTPLERVASVRMDRTETVGGPVGSLGSMLVTGGAVSADGRVVALRTYTDAYLFPAPDGDIPAALEREPIRLPLPGEPAGEAIALLPDGTLLSGSEGGAPIRAIPDAVALVSLPPLPAPPPQAVMSPPPPATSSASSGDARWKGLVVGGGLLAVLLMLATLGTTRAR